jgi:nicotinic acid mononucleotide adenylyltransferase
MVKSFRDFLTEDSGSITFVFGRFNPPTLGHRKLFEATKKIARGGTYRIYPTKTQDKKKNPLDFKEKVKYMRKMFPRHARNIMSDKDVRMVFDIVGKLYEQGFKKVTMVVGEDRVIEFDKVLNKYNGKKGRHDFYQFEEGVNVVSAGMRDPDSDDLETKMSASLLRHAATENDLETFSKGMPPEFKETQNLFNSVRKGMGLKESHNYRKHVQLEKVSDRREEYVQGELFNEGDEVVLKETNEVGTIKMCGSNYVLVEFGNIRKRCWLDSVEKLGETLETMAGEEGTDELVKAYQKDTPGQKEILDFKQFVLKDEFKLTPVLKKELEKIALGLNIKDFRDKGHKIATAMNILKRKHGYLK